MARVRMVTRTIEVLEAEVIVFDTSDMQTKVAKLELTGMGTIDDNTLIKSLRKTYESETLKVVAIKSRTNREELYGLTELDFLKHAHKLDPETRKALEEAEVTEETPVNETPVEEKPKKNSSK